MERDMENEGLYRACREHVMHKHGYFHSCRVRDFNSTPPPPAQRYNIRVLRANKGYIGLNKV